MITSDGRPARTRNTTIIVVLGPINAVGTTLQVDFGAGRGRSHRSIRGLVGEIRDNGPVAKYAHQYASQERRDGRFQGVASWVRCRPHVDHRQTGGGLLQYP